MKPRTDQRVAEGHRGEILPLQAEVPAADRQRTDEQTPDSPMQQDLAGTPGAEVFLPQPKFLQPVAVTRQLLAGAVKIVLVARRHAPTVPRRSDW